jgi:hypothetical protein
MHQQYVFTNHYHFTVLVKHFNQFGDQAKARLFMFFFIGNSDSSFDSVTNKNRFYKTQPVVPITGFIKRSRSYP